VQNTFGRMWPAKPPAGGLAKTRRTTIMRPSRRRQRAFWSTTPTFTAPPRYNHPLLSPDEAILLHNWLTYKRLVETDFIGSPLWCSHSTLCLKDDSNFMDTSSASSKHVLPKVHQPCWLPRGRTQRLLMPLPSSLLMLDFSCQCHDITLDLG